MRRRALVVGGSRGIGAAIADSLRKRGLDVTATSSGDLDTADIEGVRRYVQAFGEIDVLVLNTGGPPAKTFWETTQEDWERAFRQLFLGFCELLRCAQLRDDAYVFLITSHVIRVPEPRLVLSSSLRLGFSSVFKTLSHDLAKRRISCVNIAPGPIKTDRLKSLVAEMDEFEKGLPMGRAGAPEELAEFLACLVEHEIKYLSGVTITFDGGLSKYVL